MPDLDKVLVKRTIVLRSIVTEKLRQELAAELQAAADEVRERVQQIDFQTRAYITDLQRTDLQQAIAVRRQVDAEKKRQSELSDALLERKAQIQEMEDGAEIVRGTLESLAEVRVGDDLSQVLDGVEIVTKDDIVIEIRQRRPDEPTESVVAVIGQATDQ